MPRHSPYALCNLITFSTWCASHIRIFYASNCFCFSFNHLHDFLKSSLQLRSERLLICLICFSFSVIRFSKNDLLEVSFDPSKLNRMYSQTQPFYVFFFLLRKEVIHPHVPVGIPCYDLTPIISPTFDGSLPFGLGHRLRVLPTLMVWRAVCTRPENVFTAACWSAITSDSSFT